MKTVDGVIRRVHQLRQLHTYREREKELIRAVCAGPEEGLSALLGNLGDINAYSVPAANLVLSGLTRLGQKLGRQPDLRVDPPNQDDRDSARKRAEKKARLVASWDEEDNLEGTLNQTGLWLPGYAFAAWVVKEAVTEEGEPYPSLVNLDPYGTYPAHSSNGRQPSDLAYVYRVSARDLADKYPQHRAAILGRRDSAGGIILDPSDFGTGTASTYGASAHSSPSGAGLEVAEYYDKHGCYVVVPEKNLLLEAYENPLSGAQFVVMDKYSFSRPVGQYDQVLGLQATIAQFNVMAALALKDAVHTETNVFGELVSGQYRKGRHAVNYFTPGTQISKPVTNIPYQLFQELDRLERQFRTTAGYAVTDDAVSPAAQATGQGIDRLTAGIDMEVKQYLHILRRGIELADRKRLEWMDKCHPTRTLSMVGHRRGEPFAETYTPGKDIKGGYRTRRNYGAMAGLDDQNKISALLLLKQGDLLDDQTALEEMDLGGRSVTQVLDRVHDQKVRRFLMEALSSGQPVDPRVAMTLIEMLPDSDMKATFKKFWGPPEEEPQMSPEEAAMLAPPPAGPPPGPPPLPAELMAMLGGGGGPPGMPPMPPGMPPEMAVPA